MVVSTSLAEAEQVVAQAKARLAGALPNIDDMPIRAVSSTSAPSDATPRTPARRIHIPAARMTGGNSGSECG